jgi:hypothetical protein
LCCRPGTAVKLLWPEKIRSPPAGTTQSFPTALVWSRGNPEGTLSTVRGNSSVCPTTLGFGTARQRMVLAPGTRYNRVEGNRRASRNGPVSARPPEIPTVTIRHVFVSHLLHRLVALKLRRVCSRCASSAARPVVPSTASPAASSEGISHAAVYSLPTTTYGGFSPHQPRQHTHALDTG